MADSPVEFVLLCLTSLFTMINPVSITPVFSSITAGLPVKQVRHVALKAAMTAFAILVTFALTGTLIFKVFAISVDSLKIVGGTLLFLMGHEMVQGRMGQTQIDKPEDMKHFEEYTNNMAITPLAIPLICGPGAIATVIILMEQYKSILFRSVLFLSILMVISVTYMFLLFAKPIMDRLGKSGNKVLMRIMGLIVMVIAVEYFFGGLKPILRNIFDIVPLTQ